jgi:hypothetical protein
VVRLMSGRDRSGVASLFEHVGVAVSCAVADRINAGLLLAALDVAAEVMFVVAMIVAPCFCSMVEIDRQIKLSLCEKV